MSSFDIDDLAKHDAVFPAPESGNILIVSGFGFSGAKAKTCLPSALLAGALEPVGKVEFTDLFYVNVVIKMAALYKLPHGWALEGDRGHQIASNGSKSFRLIYDRDYNRVECAAIDLPRAAGIDLPKELDFQDGAALTDYWRDCQKRFRVYFEGDRSE